MLDDPEMAQVIEEFGFIIERRRQILWIMNRVEMFSWHLFKVENLNSESIVQDMGNPFSESSTSDLLVLDT